MVRMWLLLTLLAKNRWLAGATTKAKKVLQKQAKNQLKNGSYAQWQREGIDRRESACSTPGQVLWHQAGPNRNADDAALCQQPIHLPVVLGR